MSDSLTPHGLQPARLFCPWNFPGKHIKRGLSLPSPGALPGLWFRPAFLMSPTLAGKFFTTTVTWSIAISQNIFLELYVALLWKIILVLQSLPIFNQKWFYQTDTSFTWLDFKWLFICLKNTNLFSKNKYSQTLILFFKCHRLYENNSEIWVFRPYFE